MLSTKTEVPGGCGARELWPFKNSLLVAPVFLLFVHFVFFAFVELRKQ